MQLQLLLPSTSSSRRGRRRSNSSSSSTSATSYSSACFTTSFATVSRPSRSYLAELTAFVFYRHLHEQASRCRYLFQCAGALVLLRWTIQALPPCVHSSLPPEVVADRSPSSQPFAIATRTDHSTIIRLGTSTPSCGSTLSRWQSSQSRSLLAQLSRSSPSFQPSRFLKLTHELTATSFYFPPRSSWPQSGSSFSSPSAAGDFPSHSPRTHLERPRNLRYSTSSRTSWQSTSSTGKNGGRL